MQPGQKLGSLDTSRLGTDLRSHQEKGLLLLELSLIQTCVGVRHPQSCILGPKTNQLAEPRQVQMYMKTQATDSHLTHKYEHGMHFGGVDCAKLRCGLEQPMLSIG